MHAHRSLSPADQKEAKLPTEPNRIIFQTKSIQSVTIKMLNDSTKEKRHRGRLVINHTEVSTVKLCTLITNIQQKERYTDLTLYDGTGATTGRIWPGTPTDETDLAELQLNKYYTIYGTPTECKDILLVAIDSARLVRDHNEVTHHLFSTIYEHLHLNMTLQNSPKATIAPAEINRHDEHKASVMSFLNTKQLRDIEEGASFPTIMQMVGLDATTARSVLSSLVEEAKVYNTIDYEHFKSCSD